MSNALNSKDLRSIKKYFSSVHGNRENWLELLNANSYSAASNLIGNISSTIYDSRGRGLDDNSMDLEMFMMSLLTLIFNHQMHYDYNLRKQDDGLKLFDEATKNLCLYIIDNDIKTIEQLLLYESLDVVLKFFMLAEPSILKVKLASDWEY